MTIDTERPDGAAPEGQDQQPHLGPTPHAGVNDLPDEIDIEIAPEEGEETPPAPAPAAKVAQPAAQPKPKEPHRPKSDPERRIGQAVARQREAETAADRLKRENEELLAKLEGGQKTATELQQRAERGERVALTHHERATRAELDIANREYQAAVEGGDAKRQTEANARVSAASAEINKINDWKAAHPEPKPGAIQPQAREEPAPQRQQEQPRQQPQPSVENLAEPAKNWVAENTWFDQQAEPEMYDAAVSYAALLEHRLVRAGKQTEINTPAYFDRLTNYMRQEFPDYPWEDASAPETGDYRVVPALSATTRPPTRNGALNGQNGAKAPTAQRMPQMSRNSAVLPANGQQAPGGRQPENNQMRVLMSDDEKEMAVRQWENGAMGNHYKTGKPITDKKEAVEQWAYRKAQAARGA